MTKPIVEFHDYVMGDVLINMSDITSKRMFGGYGLYQDGSIFAIITDESELYFKVDDTNREEFKKRGSHQFIYTGHKNKKPTGMPYWLLPEEIFEGDKEALRKPREGLSGSLPGSGWAVRVFHPANH